MSDVERFVAASRSAQGLPPIVTDAAILDRIAVLIRGDINRRPKAAQKEDA